MSSWDDFNTLTFSLLSPSATKPARSPNVADSPTKHHKRFGLREISWKVEKRGKTGNWKYPIYDTTFKAGPPRGFLIIFGRWALIFFGWKLLEKMKNDVTFVRMHSADHLGEEKKGTSLRRI